MLFFLIFQRKNLRLRKYKSWPGTNRAQLEFNSISFKIQSLLFKKIIYFWLHQVLVASGVIFIVAHRLPSYGAWVQNCMVQA